MVDDCVFCDIVSGDAPANTVWENDEYLAFLSIFPNTEGATVVIPKDHHGSYAFDVPDDVFVGLTTAAKQVGRQLDAAFDDVGRTALVYEGFGVDHLHAKLFPMHGTNMDEGEQRASNINTYFEEYPGYISSHDADRADDERLEALAKRIRDHS